MLIKAAFPEALGAGEQPPPYQREAMHTGESTSS